MTSKANFFIVQMIPIFLLVSCGMGFYFRKQISGQYYLLATDSKEQLNIAYKYKQSEGYSGRIPAKVVGFAVTDSLIVAKTVNHSGQFHYYIINMNKDNDTARQEQYLYGPISTVEFEQKWSRVVNVSFVDVKDIDGKLN